MSPRSVRQRGAVVTLILVGCVIAGVLLQRSLTGPRPAETSTASAERLVPTAATTDHAAAAPLERMATTSAVSVGVPAQAVYAMPRGLWAARQRFGAGVPYPPLERYDVARLGIGWYHAWRVIEAAPAVPGVEQWQLVRVSQDGFRPDAAMIERVARSQPGAVWLIGNEPDVIWQDNTTAERYAQAYHAVYELLKQADPTCRVAAGGIAQPTPLRLAYLDRVLQSYRNAHGQPMPVDMWHIHNFILREERGTWGVDIPPGMADDRGMLYDVEDNDRIDVFKQQVIAFRHWMSERGQRDRPLVVSEYGIPMPADYGFNFERVRAFMLATFDYLLTAADPQLGYPPDGDRLVQRWAWFSMGYEQYPTGDLADLESGHLTRLGEAFGEYVGRIN
jgi:hypothetical protein